MQVFGRGEWPGELPSSLVSPPWHDGAKSATASPSSQQFTHCGLPSWAVDLARPAAHCRAQGYVLFADGRRWAAAGAQGAPAGAFKQQVGATRLPNTPGKRGEPFGW